MHAPRTLLFTLLVLVALAVGAPAATAATEAAPPAGGAAIDQVFIATAGAMLLTGGLLLIGFAWRTGRPAVVGPLVQRHLGRIADFSERVSGLPAWAAIPSAILAFTLVIALFGMMWDISLHIGDGRDEGPLANPAHYFILGGLFGLFTAGFLAMVLPKGKPGPTAVRITGDWYAPLGGVMITACGAFSLAGFPLDDVWHRIFGQDVTLWGPTHLMLLGGAAMSLIGQAVLMVEATRARAAEGEHELGWVMQVRRVALAGAFLIGLSIFQAEFDFGVPQFRFIFGPMLTMFAAAVALTATRIWLGPGSALAAVGFFLAVRGLISWLVGPVLSETTPHFPLYIAEALAVEAVALMVAREQTVRFALACGAAIGTFGLAAEWAWSHLWMPIPWSAELFPEGAVFGLAMAVAGALVGGWLGARLASHRIPRTRSLRTAAVVGAVATFALVGYALNKPGAEGIRADVRLTEVAPGPERTVMADVRFTPRDAADDAEFVNVTAWQGGGFVLADLDRTGQGTYRTSEPIPVHGTWKALIRLHEGNSMIAAPIYLPDDPAIPVSGVPATQTFSRELVTDHEILQREQKSAAGWLTAAAYLAVLAITLIFLVLIAWGLHRLAVTAGLPPGEPRERGGRSPAARPATVTG